MAELAAQRLLVEPATVRPLPLQALRLLFGVCAEDDTGAGARDAALLGLLYGAGLGPGQVTRLDLADYHWRAGTLLVRPGPGGTVHTRWLLPGSRAALDAWCVERGDPEGALFWPTNATGTPYPGRLTAAVVERIVQQRAREAGMEGLSSLDLYFTFVHDLIAAGASRELVEALTADGTHRAVGFTSHSDDAEMRQAIERLHAPYRPRASTPL
jgi:integrase